MRTQCQFQSSPRKCKQTRKRWRNSRERSHDNWSQSITNHEEALSESPDLLATTILEGNRELSRDVACTQDGDEQLQKAIDDDDEPTLQERPALGVVDIFRLHEHQNIQGMFGFVTLLLVYRDFRHLSVRVWEGRDHLHVTPCWRGGTRRAA